MKYKHILFSLLLACCAMHSAVSVKSDNPVVWYAASSTGLSGPSQFDVLKGNWRTVSIASSAAEPYYSAATKKSSMQPAKSVLFQL